MTLPDPIDLTGRFPEIWSTSSERLCIVTNAYEVKIAERLNDEESTVAFKLPATDPLRSEIQNERYVKFPALGEAYTYRIRSVEDDRDEAGLLVLSVLAEAPWYDLATVKVIYSLDLTNTTAYAALSQILAGTGWSLATVETNAINSITWSKANALAAIRQVQQTWGGELHFDVLARQVYLVEEWGEVRPVQIHWQKNLQTMRRCIDTRDVVTVLTAYGKDGISVTVTDHTYLSENRVGVIENTDIADMIALRTWATRELAKRCQPVYSYEAGAADLSILPEHATETFGVGDTVQVIDAELAISVSVRVVEREYDVLEPWRSRYVLGNRPGEFTDSVVKQEESPDKPDEEEPEDELPPDNLEDCIDNSSGVFDEAAALVQQAFDLWNTAFGHLGSSMDVFGDVLSLPSDAGPAYEAADPDEFNTVLQAMWVCVQDGQAGLGDLSALLPPLDEALLANDGSGALTALGAIDPVAQAYADSVECVSTKTTELRAAADEPLNGLAQLEQIFSAQQLSIQNADFLSASDRQAQLAVVADALRYLGLYRSDLEQMRAIADRLDELATQLNRCSPAGFVGDICDGLDPVPCCDECDYIVDGVGITGKTWVTLKAALDDALINKAPGSKVTVCLTDGDHYVNEEIEFFDWAGELIIKGTSRTGTRLILHRNAGFGSYDAAVELKMTVQDMQIYADGSVPPPVTYGYVCIGFQMYTSYAYDTASSLTLQRLDVTVDKTEHFQSYLVEAYCQTLQLIDVDIAGADIAPLVVGPTDCLLERVNVTATYVAELDLSAGFADDPNATATFRNCTFQNVGMDVGDDQTWIMTGNRYTVTDPSWWTENPDAGPWFDGPSYPDRTPWGRNPDLPHQLYGNIGLPEYGSGGSSLGGVGMVVT